MNPTTQPYDSKNQPDDSNNLVRQFQQLVEMILINTHNFLLCFSFQRVSTVYVFMKISKYYRRALYQYDPEFSDRQVWANSADPDQSDQGLHCLPFRLHLLDILLRDKPILFKFWDDYSKFFRCPKFLNFYDNLFPCCFSFRVQWLFWCYMFWRTDLRRWS